MGPPASREGWERAFRLVFERSSNGIALVDDERRFVEVNDALLAIVGATRAAIVGTSVIDLIPPRERNRAMNDWRELVHTGEYYSAGPILRRDGTEVELEVAGRLAVVGGRRLAIYVVTSPLGSWLPVKAGRAAKRELTRREREVVTLIALGRSTPQIAKELYISETTVRTHVQNAMSKLGAHTRAQLVAIALSRDDAIHPAALDEARDPSGEEGARPGD